ncbi:hypothetical protein, partial [Vampirovibrio sp.]|uniref:hypothetical protein n=1 Tax=Vampirovibrio sp. TaxID=2717857 RepID=UPI0035939F8A
PTPTPTGPIDPGSLELKDIPVDAQGNMTAGFVNQLFKTSGNVNTAILSDSEPSGMTKFARIGLRMLGHDLYDGEINGDVAFRTLLAPDESHNRGIFQGSRDNAQQIAENKDMVRKWGELDLKDDGKVNGSVYIKLTEDVWPTTDEVAITGFAKDIKTRNSTLKASELLKATTNVETPAGVTEFAAKTGVSPKELLNFSLWGHRILDRSFTTEDLAQDALTNPRSIDFGLTQFNQENRAYMQSLTTDPNAKSTVGLGVLNLLTKLSNNLP